MEYAVSIEGVGHLEAENEDQAKEAFFASIRSFEDALRDRQGNGAVCVIIPVHVREVVPTIECRAVCRLPRPDVSVL